MSSKRELLVDMRQLLATLRQVTTRQEWLDDLAKIGITEKRADDFLRHDPETVEDFGEIVEAIRAFDERLKALHELLSKDTHGEA